jgi:hypothetical protein
MCFLFIPIVIFLMQYFIEMIIPFQTPFHSGTKLTIFVAGSWNPKNDSFSSPAKILRVQQLNMHTEYSKFQLPSYCLKMFRGTGQIVAVLGYWSPVNF